MSSELRTTHCELKANVHALDYNYNRALSGVKSSCTAYRAQLQDIRKLCDRLRKLTLIHQREIPVKKRQPKKVVEPEPVVEEEPEPEPDVVVVEAPKPKISSKSEQSSKPKAKRVRKPKKAPEPVEPISEEEE